MVNVFVCIVCFCRVLAVVRREYVKCLWQIFFAGFSSRIMRGYAPKVYLPRLHPVTPRVSYTLPKALLAEPGKLGSCSACPIAIFC